jgi:hypothetical protein
MHGVANRIIRLFANLFQRANTMSLRELVRLRDRYPTASRMTRYRMRKEPGFPDGVDILGTEYHYVDELQAYEESRRRLGKAMPKRSAEAEAT